jgi:HEAT repeats
MNDIIRAAIFAIKNVTSRETALDQLTTFDSDTVVKELVDVVLENNLPEIGQLVIPLMTGLQSEDFAQLELSTCDILQIGYSSVPFLEKHIIQYPSSHIASKIKAEIEQLEKNIFTVIHSKRISDEINFAEFIDIMIRATKIAVSLGSIPDKSLTQRKLKEVIEINIDAWENARSEILALNTQAVDFLQTALIDPSDVQFRRVAARMLGLLHEASSIVPLIQALRDGDAVVRNEAILALAEFPSEEVMQHILDVVNPLKTR